MNYRALIYILQFSGILFLSSCVQQKICPAYQSAFIYDKEHQKRQFSYFVESDLDTLVPKGKVIGTRNTGRPRYKTYIGQDDDPHYLTVSRDNRLLIAPRTFKERLKRLESVPLERIYPVLADSLLMSDEALAVALERGDSLAADSLMAAATGYDWRNENFNIEMINYLMIFDKVLVYPEERAWMEEEAARKKEASKTEKKSFFKRIFPFLDKKKKDEDEVAGEEEAPKEKKGFFSFLKRKDKPPKEKKSKDTTEDDDDPLPPEKPQDDEVDDDEGFG